MTNYYLFFSFSRVIQLVITSIFLAIVGWGQRLPGSGNSLSFSASGPVAYRWSTGATTAGITVSQAGTYTVTATSPAGCTRQASYRVRLGRVAPTFTLGADTTLCEDSALTLSGPAGAGLRHQWSDGWLD